jgi:hypothetical protein
MLSQIPRVDRHGLASINGLTKSPSAAMCKPVARSNALDKPSRRVA